MSQKQQQPAASGKRFVLRSRPHPEPIGPETPRFHFFLIDSGWNAPVSKVLRSQLPLFHQFNPHDTLYLLTHEQSVRILKNAPEHIGLDPIVVVYDLLNPCDTDTDGVENYRGFRLNLGLIKNPEQALQRLQHFLRFIAINRTSDCLECEVKRELHKEGLGNMVKILREASEASIELL
jgi:hypothetical protein